MKEKKDSQEKSEKQKEFEDMQKLQMQILQSNSLFLGANNLKNDYGKEGSNIADSFMNSGDVLKAKQKMLEEQRKEAEEMGIGYSPEMPTNYELIKNAKKMSQGAMQILTLGNLEKIAKTVNPGLTFDVAKDFKEKTYMDLNDAIKKANGNPQKLDEKSKDLLQYHSLLSEAYEKGSVMALMQNTYINQYNQIGKQLAEKYKSKESLEKKNENK
jgi:hypothetical protein